MPDEVTSKRPGLTRFEGETVVLGIRPEDIEDAEIEADAPNDRRISTTVDLRESLGSEVLVHFSVAEAPVLTEDTKELARDLGVHDTRERQGDDHVRREAGSAITCAGARVDRTRGRHGAIALLRPAHRARYRHREGIRMNRKRWVVGVATVAILTLIAAACSSDSSSGASDTGTTSAAPDLTGQTVDVAATWTSAEQRNFEQVLALFEQQTGATTQFVSTGDDIAAYLGPKIEGGKPPDVAILPQPGVVASFASQGDLVPIEDFAGDLIDANYAPGAREVGTVDGTLYAVWFRAAQKSTVWYNTHVFDDAGVQPPTTWDELVSTAQTISDSGVPPYSVGVDVGWPMSDLFENIYLRTAGPDMYDKLARHEIPWTDQSVKDALSKMADVIGNSDEIAGGTQGALQTDFNGSVDQMFTDPPAGAMLFEGNFVGGGVAGGARRRSAPTPTSSTPWIGSVAARRHRRGDLAVLLDDTPAGEALIKFLATPEAAEVWAGLGGYISPNKNVDIYPTYTDPVDQRAAQALIDAGDAVRYDMSDLQPTAFGATTGQGVWGILTDFVSDPSDIDGTAQQLEAAAKAAYK